MARERRIDAKLLLLELQGLLSSGIVKVYTEMAGVDWRLGGKGFLEKVPLRPVDKEVRSMNQFVDERVRSELAMWRPKSSVEEWYERNRFCVWAFGLLVAAIVSLCVKFL